MDDVELRLECAKLAVPLAGPDRAVTNVVGIATELYNFVKPQPVAETPQVADKSKRGRKASEPDILS